VSWGSVDKTYPDQLVHEVSHVIVGSLFSQYPLNGWVPGLMVNLFPVSGARLNDKYNTIIRPANNWK